MSKSSRRLIWSVLFVVGAVLWFLAARALWQTSIPAGLKLPHVNVHEMASSSELHRARHFNLVLDWIGVIGLVLPLIVLGLYARWGHKFMRESAAGPIGTGMLLAMLGLGILWLTLLPADIVALWWERRYGIEKTGYFQAIFGSWYGLSGEFLDFCLIVLIIMGLARWLKDRWWLAAAPLMTGVVLFGAFVQPYLSGLKPLHDHQALVQAEHRLGDREGVGHIPLKVEQVSSQTTAPNAEAMGIGPSRRIALYDTILDGRFSERQLEVVVAHELGHHKHHDIWRSVGWFGLFSLPIGLIIALFTRRRGGMYAPYAVPLFLFLWTLLPTITLPLDNAFSRRMEANADWTALQATRDPEAAKALYSNFVRKVDDDPSPPGWATFLFDNHPTDSQRYAMVLAWQKRNGG